MASQLLSILQQGLDVQEKHQQRELDRALRQLELGTQVEMQEQRLDFEAMEGERERGFTLTRDYIDDLQRALELDVEADREMDRIVYESTQERLLTEAGFRFDKEIEEARQLHDKSKYESGYEHERELTEFKEEAATARTKMVEEGAIHRAGMGYAHDRAMQEEAEKAAARSHAMQTFNENVNMGKAQADRNKMDAFHMLTSKFNFQNLGENASVYKEQFTDLAEEIIGDGQTVLASQLFDTIVNYQTDPVAGKGGMESMLREIEELYKIQKDNPYGATAVGDMAKKQMQFLEAIGFIPPGAWDRATLPAVDAVLYKEGDKIPEGKKVGDIKIPAKEATEGDTYFKSDAFESILDSVTKNNEVIANLDAEWNEKFTPEYKDDKGNLITDPDEIWKQRYLFQRDTSPVTPDITNKALFEKHQKTKQMLADFAKSVSGAGGAGGSHYQNLSTLSGYEASTDISRQAFLDQVHTDLQKASKSSGAMTILLTTMKDYYKDRARSQGKSAGLAELEAENFVDNLRGTGKDYKMGSKIGVGDKDNDAWVGNWFNPKYNKFAEYLRDPSFWNQVDANTKKFLAEEGQNNNIDWEYTAGDGPDYWDWRGGDYQRDKLKESLSNIGILKNTILKGHGLYDVYRTKKQDEDDFFDSLSK